MVVKFFASLLLVWILVSTCSLPLSAQIVNIEDKRRTLDTLGWAGQIDLGGQFTQNSSSVLTLSAALRMDHKRAHSNYLALANYNLVRAAGSQFINDGFGHLRAGYQLSGPWYWEAFGQLQYNRNLSIALRGLMGTGPRLEVTNGEQLDMTVGLLYMFEYNELNEGEVFRRDSRMSTYLSLQFTPQPYLAFNSTSYYQPLLTGWDDGRFSTVNTLIINVSEHLKLTSSLSLVYDGLLARIAENVPSTTYQWKNGLRFQF